MSGTSGSRRGSVAVLLGVGGVIAAATLAIVLWPMVSPVETAVVDAKDPTPETVIQTPQATPSAVAPQADVNSVQVAPVAPEVEPAVRPEVDTVRIDAQGAAVMAGTAEPGAKVEIRAGDDVVATGTASSGGDFALLFDLPASDVPRALSVTSTDSEGVRESADARVIVAATAATPPTPEVSEVASAPAEAVTTAPTEGTAEIVTDFTTVAPTSAPTVLRADSAGIEVVQGAPELVTSIGIDTISYDADGDVLLSGRGEVESQVRVYLDNAPVKTTEIGIDGTWRADLPDVETGFYTLRVDEIAVDGTVVSRLETPFQRTAPSLAAAQFNEGVSVVTVQPGFTLWGIAEDRFGDGFQYVQVFEANRDLIRNPDLIYPGQVFTLPAEIELQ